jgi:hypothetical protein
MHCTPAGALTLSMGKFLEHMYFAVTVKNVAQAHVNRERGQGGGDGDGREDGGWGWWKGWGWWGGWGVTTH